ncbi:hypothetical protein DAEQUDRAFT_682397 [Daedalea quercina L-15889]|uniref:Ubiquitin-like-conjugating enzyme ATG10 n=1 Tax=Daedalea quercina L-15889 TaxID=1314783 RepID=A0A165U682_9APHY|nr:hypothetical protein DAEQUDRAFT_682397 [Daedalea quercina L-15889]
MSASLSRFQFETACKAYIAAHTTQPSDDASTTAVYPVGWTWNKHACVPGLGFMSRSVALSVKAVEAAEGDHELELLSDSTEDEAAASESREVLTCIQSVVYSPTFQVPAFYFTIHRSNGVPLNLSEIMASSLLRRHAVPLSNTTTFALSEHGASFPLLSQGDHPVLGTPAWYFHPCHTPEAVGEVVSELQYKGGTKEQILVRWMEVWFMVIGQIVDLHRGL